ncbi:MAG TPA: type I-F CRISPR-associated protein Csy2 [Pseudomonas sp.]|nr:type I-F CRISPR-associated protein Csy2 [Pseudomonas sp.]MBB51850.1 type I-F CRISPR-associated protein Csy2 [Pseudomonadales bacterium]MBB52341.1 type I-F CRISPR-associated protein Csy2 [Pseudomonadales bacterium]HCA24272.1 type I-F CRISPR-associated protein Csy2 [Pseudomonas sp.]|tara:strand:- start:15173 stop:16144 length:972 start_codon:yes stop_codon:yes gene_type:complete
MTEINSLLILPRLQVQAANAVSGPLTWGFPAPTAFAGFAHALERRLASELPGGFAGVGIICHRFEPQVYRAAGNYTHAFCLTRNPVDKDGATASLVEEGKAHLEVTLVIALADWVPEDDRSAVLVRINRAVLSMRLAGGSLLPQRPGLSFAPRLEEWPSADTDRHELFRRLRRYWLPGFALTLREDRLAQALQRLREAQPQATALDALLDLSRLNVEPSAEPEPNGSTEWRIRRREGWLVPLPIGYAGLSELHAPGKVLNSRDNQTPVRFVESLYSMGEWVSPHRLTCLEQLLWHHNADPQSGIYRCTNRYTDYLTDAAEGIA